MVQVQCKRVLGQLKVYGTQFIKNIYICVNYYYYFLFVILGEKNKFNLL